MVLANSKELTSDLRLSPQNNTKMDSERNGLNILFFTPKPERKTTATTDAPQRWRFQSWHPSSEGWPWTDERVQNHPSFIHRVDDLGQINGSKTIHHKATPAQIQRFHFLGTPLPLYIGRSTCLLQSGGPFRFSGLYCTLHRDRSQALVHHPCTTKRAKSIGSNRIIEHTWLSPTGKHEDATNARSPPTLLSRSLELGTHDRKIIHRTRGSDKNNTKCNRRKYHRANTHNKGTRALSPILTIITTKRERLLLRLHQ